MNSLLQHKDFIFDLKKKVENNDESLFEHFVINNNNLIIDDNTISIVMTSCNRSKQVLFTLSTINRSIFKNVQVILVDDSNTDPVIKDILTDKNYPFHIDLIKIKRENKKWHNPVVNYNIGFQFIRGGKVIIQNAECCHIGDVLKFVDNNAVNDNYYVFDVKASLNYETNNIIYEMIDKNNIFSSSIYEHNIYYGWYQSESRNEKFHFLTALTKDTFDKVNRFSYDYTMGTWYDDNDFLLRIISKKINVLNIFHNIHNIGGIHLFHGYSSAEWDNGKESNQPLLINKQKIFNFTGVYIDITEEPNTFEEKYKKLL